MKSFFKTIKFEENPANQLIICQNKTKGKTNFFNKT